MGQVSQLREDIGPFVVEMDHWMHLNDERIESYELRGLDQNQKTFIIVVWVLPANLKRFQGHH